MVAQHEQQHVETLLATLQLVTSTALSRFLPPATRAAPRTALPREVRFPAGDVTIGSDDAWAYDNERPTPPRRRGRLLHRPHPGHQRGVRRLHRGRRLPRRALWKDAGWEHRISERLEHPRSGVARRGMGAAALRPLGATPGRRAGVPRVLVRGGRLCPLGGTAPAHRGRVGEGGRRWSPDGDDAAVALGRRAARWPSAPTSGRSGHPPPVGSFPRGRERVGRGAAHRRRLGVDSSDFLPYPGFDAFPYPEYSAVFFGSEPQGAARRLLGGRAGGHPCPPFATGTCPSAGRFSPASAVPATPETALESRSRHAPRLLALTGARTRGSTWTCTSRPGRPRPRLRADVRLGLTPPRELPPKWFYDERGSRLFDAITRLPEYYPTRREREILSPTPGDCRRTGASTLVELGSGTSEKTRILLAAPRARHAAAASSRSTSTSRRCARRRRLAEEYPGLARPCRGGGLRATPARLPRAGARLIAFLGGTVGNLARHRGRASSAPGAARCRSTRCFSARTW